MTELEQSSLESFNELVSLSGQLVTVGDDSVLCSVQFIEREDAEHQLDPGHGQDATVKALISEWPAAHIERGTNFDIPSLSLNFRIKNTRQDSLFYLFRCAVR